MGYKILASKLSFPNNLIKEVLKVNNMETINKPIVISREATKPNNFIKTLANNKPT